MLLYAILLIVTICILYILSNLLYPIFYKHNQENFKNIQIKGDKPCEIHLSPEKLQQVTSTLQNHIKHWDKLQQKSRSAYKHSYDIYRTYVNRRNRLQRKMASYKKYLSKGSSMDASYSKKISEYNSQLQKYKNTIGAKQTQIASYKSTLRNLQTKVKTLPTFHNGLSWKRVDGYRENAGWLANNKGIVESGKVMSIRSILFAFQKHSTKLRKQKQDAIRAIYKRYSSMYHPRFRLSPIFRRIWRVRRNIEAQRIHRNQRYNINNINLPERQTYCVEVLGYFRPQTTGNHKFAIHSDDFSYLWIGHENDQELPITRFSGTGGRMVTPTIHNGGAHGMRKRYSGMLQMVKGKYYPLRIQFGERRGGDNLVFSFIPPNSAEQTDGRGYFFHAEGHSFAKYNLIRDNYSALNESKRLSSRLRSSENSLNQIITVYNNTRRNRDTAVNMQQRLETQRINTEKNIASTEARISRNTRGMQRYSQILRHYKSRISYYKKRKTAIEQYFQRVSEGQTLPIDDYTMSNINLGTSEETPPIQSSENVLNWPKCYRRVEGGNKMESRISAEERRVRAEYTEKLDVVPYGADYAQLRFHSQDAMDYIPKSLLRK